MKDITRHMIRSAARRKKRRERERFIEEQKTPPAPTLEEILSSAPVEIPEGWDRRYQLEMAKEAVPAEERKEVSRQPQARQDETEEEVGWQRAWVPERKKRQYTCAFSCSVEEAEIFKAHAKKLGVPFSQWVRDSLFRTIGRRAPARPKRDY